VKASSMVANSSGYIARVAVDWHVWVQKVAQCSSIACVQFRCVVLRQIGTTLLALLIH
jgi:hypothetical protein